MQFNKLPKFVTVSADTDEELDYKIDAATRKISSAKGKLMDIHWHADKPLHVTLVFEITKVVCETLAEKYESNDCAFYCEECKCFNKTTDGRVKWTRCDQGTSVKPDSYACEWFYEQFEAGEDVLVNDPDKPIRLVSIARRLKDA